MLTWLCHVSFQAQGLGSLLSREEMAELRSLAAASDLDLPNERALQRPPRRR